MAGVDVERANAARMYDYFLGGAHNFAVDRSVADRAAASNPGIRAMARANRTFLTRVVRWCAGDGIDQFLDLGSGVPTAGNVHEIAHRLVPDARVAYVDVDPVAVASATELLGSLDTVSVTRADLREPSAVLDAPDVAALLDFTRPMALLMVAVLHFVDGDAAALLARYRSALAPGSVVVVSHTSDDQDDPALADVIRAGAAVYAAGDVPCTHRSRAELRGMLAGLELVEPGLVDVLDWPTARRDRSGAGSYGVVARVP